MSACDKHKGDPARGYSPCAGCEVERLHETVRTLKAMNSELQEALVDVTASLAWHAQGDRLVLHGGPSSRPVERARIVIEKAKKLSL